MMFTIIRKLITIFGTIFVVTSIVSLILSLILKYRYYSKSGKKKVDESDKERENPERRIALITGASSGLGREFVYRIDKKPDKYGVDEIWLVARRKERLEKLQDELDTPSEIFSLDITEQKSIEILKERLKEERKKDTDFSVSLLINAAGIGKTGHSADMGFEAEKAMIDINDTAAVAMTQLAIPYINEGGRIMEICSVAAFQPIPNFNTYAASKVFLLWYSRALNMELAPKGISVTAVCPYWIRDTEFIRIASDGRQEAAISSKAADVASRALRAAVRRDAVSTPGIITTLDRIFGPVVATELMARLASLMSLHDKKELKSED